MKYWVELSSEEGREAILAISLSDLLRGDYNLAKLTSLAVYYGLTRDPDIVDHIKKLADPVRRRRKQVK